MTGPKIENSERGITINKTLAWTIITALVLGGLWVGRQVTLSEQGLVAVAQTMEGNARDIAALTTALEAERVARQAALRELDGITRSNQLAITRAQSDTSNIIAGLARIEARLDRIEPYRGGREYEGNTP